MRVVDWVMDGPLAPLVIIGAVMSIGAAALMPVLAIAFALGA